MAYLSLLHWRVKRAQTRERGPPSVWTKISFFFSSFFLFCFFRCTCLHSHILTSPPTDKNWYPKFRNPKKTFEIFKKHPTPRGQGGARIFFWLKSLRWSAHFSSCPYTDRNINNTRWTSASVDWTPWPRDEGTCSNSPKTVLIFCDQKV